MATSATFLNVLEFCIFPPIPVTASVAVSRTLLTVGENSAFSTAFLNDLSISKLEITSAALVPAFLTALSALTIPPITFLLLRALPYTYFIPGI